MVQRVSGPARILPWSLLSSRPLISVFDPSPWLLAALDATLGLLAIYLAIAARFESFDAGVWLSGYSPSILLPLVVRPIVNHATGVYSMAWRNASVHEFYCLVLAAGIATGVSALLFYAVLAPLELRGTQGFPRSFWLIEGLLYVALVGALRVAVRVYHHASTAPSHAGGRGIPTLLFGAGSAGAALARSAIREPRAGILPVGFLDDDPRLRGRHVAGLPVFGGLDRLREAVSATGVQRMIITMPSATGAAIRRAVAGAHEQQLVVHTVPSVADLLDTDLDAYRVRSVKVEDLLGRRVVPGVMAGTNRALKRARVLVTGGAGSIGSELSRQILEGAPATLAVADRAESPLYEIEQELKVRLDRQDGGASGDCVRPLLVDITHPHRLRQLFLEQRPQFVFHAAALKHVPMMEARVCDAVLVNIGGTLAVLRASLASDVQRFVLVSTDKAVEPSSVMGATKRVAEMLVRQVALSTGRPYVAVRFGNVLGSSGSVVRLFQSQLERGLPLTITDPRMVRYFMTIPEAARLVLAASALGAAGDLFILEMGEQLRIVDVAKDLIRLSGRDPDSVPFNIVGTRPGEKLSEELSYGTEEVEPTTQPGVLRMRRQPPVPPDLLGRVEELIDLANAYDDEPVRARLFDLVRSG